LPKALTFKRIGPAERPDREKGSVTMFGDMPLPAKFFIAFVIVLALIGGVAWLVRRFGAGALTASSARGRQARLGVIEATAIDGRRRLVLVRRDNVEHLIMLGGPSDVVVEANIVRAQAAAAREGQGQRVPEPAGRPAAPENGLWPAGPEPAYRGGRGPERPMPPAVADELPLQPHAEPAPRAATSDRLTGLAQEIARSARVEPPPRPPEPQRRMIEQKRPPAAPARAPEDLQSSDRHLAAMAQQLEAALRRPGQAVPARESAAGESGMPMARRPASEPRPGVEPRSSLMDRAKQSRAAASLSPPRAGEPATAHAETGESPAPAPAEAIDAAPAPDAAPPEPAREPGGPDDGRAVASEPAETKAPSLEEEMANLLGRPSGKT
jgi:hypothetical protein